MSLFEQLQIVGAVAGEAKKSAKSSTGIVDMSLEELRAACKVRHYRRKDGMPAIDGTVELTVMLGVSKVDLGAEYIAVPAASEEEATDQLFDLIDNGAADVSLFAVQARLAASASKVAETVSSEQEAA